MKILNINKFYYVRGGSERFFFELQELLESKGHRVVPFAMRHDENLKTEYDRYFVSKVQTETIGLGWQGLRTAGRYLWSWSAQRKLAQLIREEEPELAVLHNIYHQISPSILPVLKKHRITVVLVAHDYGLLSPNYHMFVRGGIYDRICGRGWLRCIPDRCVRDSRLASLVCALETWFHHSVLKVYQRNIDYVLCPSKFMYEMFARAGWPPDKLVHLPYFIRPLKHQGRVGAVPDQEYILYFGRLSEEKGIAVLIKAMKLLPEVRLKVAGSGPQEARLRAHLSRDRIDNIQLVGYKSGDQLAALIGGAQFVVVPSLWYENYPLSILEAYSLGIPALVSDLGGLPEMALADELLFRAGDIEDLVRKVRSLWRNRPVLDQAGKKAMHFIREHNDPEAYYQRLVQLHQKVMPGRNPARPSSQNSGP